VPLIAAVVWVSLLTSQGWLRLAGKGVGQGSREDVAELRRVACNEVARAGS
jgi:hypothetical protein